MAAPTTISNNLSSKFTPINWPKQRCSTSPHTSFVDSFSSSRSIFSHEVILRKAVGRNNGLWVVPKACDDWITASAFRKDDDDDEGIRGLQEEAFMDGPSELIPSKLVFHEIESTLNRLSKWIILATFIGYILWRHDAEAFWFAAGSALNVMLSVELKYILNQERPSNLKSDPGMPSSHAQTLFFFAMFAILSSVKWVGMNEFTIAVSVLALAFGSYFSYLRVSQELHTLSQVVVGAAFGTLFCLSWYWIWNAIVLNAVGSSSVLKTIVVLGSAGFWFGYISYSILQWIKQE